MWEHRVRRRQNSGANAIDGTLASLREEARYDEGIAAGAEAGHDSSELGSRIQPVVSVRSVEDGVASAHVYVDDL
jgi:hypothetical protein